MQPFNQKLLYHAKRSMTGKGNFRKVFSFFMLLSFLAFSLPAAWGSVTQGDLTGKVMDKETGKPVANAYVTATGVGSTFSTTTDATGFFSIVDLTPGTYQLTIERVGYQSTTVTEVQVAANSTYFQTFQVEPAVYKVQGITVSGYRNQMVNPRQTMTYYAFTKQDLQELLPGVAGLSTLGVLDELPGVQNYQATSGFTFGGPKVRGGSGFGTVYAIDGIPLNNSSFFNDLGNVGLNTGLSDYQFYPGIYPVQYGNGSDGYQNTIVPEGYGDFHGDLAFSYGFWLDPGETAPVINNATGSVVGTGTLRPANPDIWNLDVSGQVNKFHYYLNYIAEDEGGSSITNYAALQALSFEGQGAPVYRNVRRDGALQLNYDFDPSNSLSALYMNGIQQVSIEGPTPYPPDPATESTFTANPNYLYPRYDLESVGYTHRFSAGNAMTLRLWQYYNDDDAFPPTPTLAFYSQDNTQRNTGARLEFKFQLNPQNAVNVGGQYIYDKAYVHADCTNQGGCGRSLPIIGLSNNGEANTQNPSAWLNWEWTPTPKWDINAGVRWDEMIYQPIQGPGILTQANGLPFAANTFTGFSPDTTSLSTSCTPLLNVCISPGTLRPSFVQPRISASYRVTDNFTVKAGWGEFSTFAPADNVDYLSQLCAAGTGAAFASDCHVIGSVALSTAGNVAQTGQDYDLSLEYMLDQESGSFIKVTPYYKTTNNPLIFTFIALAATGGTVNATSMTAKGVELVLHTRDWHGLTGTLNYTYNQTRLVGDSEFASLLVPFIGLSSNVTGAFVGQPNALPNAAALFAAQNTASIPADWDIPHTLNLLLDYHTPNKKWDIAPNFTFASGEDYGLGSSQLQALYANMVAACAGGPTALNPYLTAANCAADVPATFTANGETTPNSLRAPDLFLGNLAISYHFSKNVSATFQVFNLWNNSQIIGYDSSILFPVWMKTFGYPFTPAFSPLNGKYAPGVVQSLREYFITTTFSF